MQYVLVSSCLLGNPVRYNGAHKRADSAILRRWEEEGRVVAVCPEVAGGLPVPRPPAEIAGGAGGAAVLAALARVVDPVGHDLTDAFLSGAQQALRQARERTIHVAVLKEGSPSCGSGYVYDGTFSGRKLQDRGVTTALLEHAGVMVFNELQIAAADELLRRLDADRV